MNGFEKRGHFEHVIFERTPVFKWLLLSQTLLKLNAIFLCIIFDHSACCISNFRAMVPNLDEWQQVENMHAFENYMREVTPFLKSAHKSIEIHYEQYY